MLNLWSSATKDHYRFLSNLLWCIVCVLKYILRHQWRCWLPHQSGRKVVWGSPWLPIFSLVTWLRLKSMFLPCQLPFDLFFALLPIHFLLYFWGCPERDTWRMSQSWEHWKSYLRVYFLWILQVLFLRCRCEYHPWIHFYRAGRCTLPLWHRVQPKKIYL